jgi:glycosyltransferase involved in cell wall biosynthesis
MMTQSQDLSLILACYNEQGIIEQRTGKIFQLLDTLGIGIEVIFVDDASQDETGRLIDRILIDNPGRNLRKIAHLQNAGRGGAVSSGIRAAGGLFVGFIDVDLEVKPDYIAPCLRALEQGYDVATVRRIYKLQPGSLHRQFMSRAYNVLVKWQTGVPLTDTEAGFKFFRRERILPVLDQVQDQGWFWDTEFMVQAHCAGLRIIEIPARFERCADKTSSVRLWRDSVRQFRKLRQLGRSISANKAAPG